MPGFRCRVNYKWDVIAKSRAPLHGDVHIQEQATVDCAKLDITSGGLNGFIWALSSSPLTPWPLYPLPHCRLYSWSTLLLYIFLFWTPVIWGCCSAGGTFHLSDTSCGKKPVASPMKGARWSRVITNCCGCSLSLYLSINLSICSYCNSYHQHESLHTAAESD